MSEIDSIKRTDPRPLPDWTIQDFFCNEAGYCGTFKTAKGHTVISAFGVTGRMLTSEREL